MLNTMYFQSILTNKCAQLSTEQLCNLGFRLLFNQLKKLKLCPLGISWCKAFRVFTILMKSHFEDFKMALMAHDGWCVSRSSVRLRIGFALDSHICAFVVFVCVQWRADIRWCMSLSEICIIFVRVCSTQLVGLLSLLFFTHTTRTTNRVRILDLVLPFLYVHRMPTTVSRLACTRT
jgi:hypothetical protein